MISFSSNMFLIAIFDKRVLYIIPKDCLTKRLSLASKSYNE